MRRRTIAWPLVLVIVMAGAGAARAQDYFRAPDPLVFKVDRERSIQDRIVIGSLFGGAVLFGGIGVLFHLDSKRKSDAVSTDSGRHSGKIYSPEIDDTRSAAYRSRNLTIASYALSGGSLIATLVAFVLTDPGHETIQLGEQHVTPRVHLTPTGDGAVIGTGWSF
jgi:hypothetical protein